MKIIYMGTPDFAVKPLEAIIEAGYEVSAVVTQAKGYGEAHYIRLRGLTPDAAYRDALTGEAYPANALMDMGLQLPIESGEYRSYTYLLERL